MLFDGCQTAVDGRVLGIDHLGAGVYLGIILEWSDLRVCIIYLFDGDAILATEILDEEPTVLDRLVLIVCLYWLGGLMPPGAELIEFCVVGR